jgi:hypothetical protein
MRRHGDHAAAACHSRTDPLRQFGLEAGPAGLRRSALHPTIPSVGRPAAIIRKRSNRPPTRRSRDDVPPSHAGLLHGTMPPAYPGVDQLGEVDDQQPAYDATGEARGPFVPDGAPHVGGCRPGRRQHRSRWPAIPQNRAAVEKDVPFFYHFLRIPESLWFNNMQAVIEKPLHVFVHCTKSLDWQAGEADTSLVNG